MTDIDYRMREAIDPVLTEFGAAMLICQGFESSLCFLLALISEHKVPKSFNASWDFHSEKTLGRLVSALKEQLDVSAELEKYLEESVDLRNKIVHGFLIGKNALKLYKPKGRLELIHELQGMKVEIKKRDITINKLIDALLNKYGSSTKDLKDNAERYWQAVNFEPSPGGSGEPH